MSLRDLMLRAFFKREQVDSLDVALLWRGNEVTVDGYKRLSPKLSEWRMANNEATHEASWDGFMGDVSFDHVALMRGNEVEQLFPQGNNTIAAGNPIVARLRVALDE